ncbi:MAG: FkbM family methyltransferase [Solirubrobacterales bacterium]
MTVLHRMRKVARRFGLDVQRADSTGSARLGALLRNREITCVLDVGANSGQYARRLRRAGYAGEIRSFEPLPDAFSRLARRASRDPRWQAERVALGPRDGETELHVSGNPGATSSSILPMLPRHRQAAPDARYLRTIEVPIRRLDTIWHDVVPAGGVNFLKLDVQGFEVAALDGASQSLGRVAGLQMEISLVPLYEGAPSLRDILNRTDALGMHLVHLEPGFFDPHTRELLQVDGVFMRPHGPLPAPT